MNSMEGCTRGSFDRPGGGRAPLASGGSVGFRGMHSMDSAQHLLDGLAIDYNYFRKHEGLKGRTPAQAAKAVVPFTEWADVVRADIKVPSGWKKKVVKRGTARIPRKNAKLAKEIADKKRAKRYGTTEGRAKAAVQKKGRVRGPKAILPEAGVGPSAPKSTVDGNYPLFGARMMRGLRPKPPNRTRG